MIDKLFRIDFYPKDWLFDTGRLTPEERGIYIQIVCLIYANRGPIENDANWIAGVSGCSSRKVKAVVSSLIQKKFLTENGSKLSQKRAEYELNNKRTHLENSAKGGRKKAENESEDSENKDLASSDDDEPPPTPIASPSPSPIAKEKTSSSEPEPSSPEIQMAFSIYNEVAKRNSIPIAQKLSEQRKKGLKARLKDAGGLEGWRIAMEKVDGNPFLTGKGERGWKADIDFFLREQAFTRLMEGKYDETYRTSSPGGSKSDRAKAAIQSGLDSIPDPEPPEYDPETGELLYTHEG